MANPYPDEYEDRFMSDVDPGYNVLEVDDVEHYMKTHKGELEVHDRYEKDLEKLKAFLDKLREQGVIVEG